MGEDELTSAQERRLRRELSSVESFRQTNRMLEVGAGRGWFLSVAAQTGWETWAVEVNSDAVEHLNSKGIHRIIVEAAEDFEAPEQSVDVVRMWDVIEHLRSPRNAVTIRYIRFCGQEACSAWPPPILLPCPVGSTDPNGYTSTERTIFSFSNRPPSDACLQNAGSRTFVSGADLST